MVRAFFTSADNEHGYPAKDRSGKLRVKELANLQTIFDKINKKEKADIPAARRTDNFCPQKHGAAASSACTNVYPNGNTCHQTLPQGAHAHPLLFPKCHFICTQPLSARQHTRATPQPMDCHISPLYRCSTAVASPWQHPSSSENTQSFFSLPFHQVHPPNQPDQRPNYLFRHQI